MMVIARGFMARKSVAMDPDLVACSAKRPRSQTEFAQLLPGQAADP